MVYYFKKTSKLSTVLNIFFKSQILCGIDFGYFYYKSFKIRCGVKYFCVFSSTLLCSVICIFLEKNYPGDWFWYGLYLTQYLFIVLNFVLRKSKDTVFKLKSAIKKIDLKLKSESASPFIERREAVCISINYLYRLIWSTYYCSLYASCLKPAWISICFSMVLTSVDIVVTTYTFLLYSICHRLEILVSSLEESSDMFANHQEIYKLIVEVTEKFKKFYDSVFMMSLLCNIPEIMFSLYYIIREIKQKNESSMWMLPFKFENLAEIFKLTITIAPAILAGMLCTQAEKIKIILYDKRLSLNDNAKSYEIERFIRYVEARPLKFTVYKVIPLDATLLGMVLSFCATYLIVMIQLTHVY